MQYIVSIRMNNGTISLKRIEASTEAGAELTASKLVGTTGSIQWVARVLKSE